MMGRFPNHIPGVGKKVNNQQKGDEVNYPDILFYWTGFIVLILLLILVGIIAFVLILNWWIRERLKWVEAWRFYKWAQSNQEAIDAYAKEKGFTKKSVWF